MWINKKVNPLRQKALNLLMKHIHKKLSLHKLEQLDEKSNKKYEMGVEFRWLLLALSCKDSYLGRLGGIGAMLKSDNPDALETLKKIIEITDRFKARLSYQRDVVLAHFATTEILPHLTLLPQDGFEKEEEGEHKEIKSVKEEKVHA